MAEHGKDTGEGAGVTEDELEGLAHQHKMSVEEAKRLIAGAGARSREAIEALLSARAQQHTGNPHTNADASSELQRRDEGPSKHHGDKIRGA